MKKVILFGMAAVMMAACEKPIMDDAYDVDEGDANVVLRFAPYQQQGFTRAATQLTNQCSRLSVAVFDEDDAKVGSVKNQKAGDSGFGTVSLSLQEGVYTVVAIAHNGEGNATITSPTKVTFPSNKMTDTFCYCGELEVTGDMISQELQMQRVVAMMRLTLTDEQIPDNVARLKFYYTGGSSTLNPRTGYGCVNSKQTEYRYTVVDGSAVNTFDIYTAPHEQNDILKLTITSQDADNSVISEFSPMENIPVTRNKITTWEGSLFDGGGMGGGATSEGGIGLTLDTQWDGTINYTW